jgi:hypothetical protein
MSLPEVPHRSICGGGGAGLECLFRKRRTRGPFPRRAPAAPGAAGPCVRLPAGPGRMSGTPSM